MPDPLAAFSPPVRQWFRETFGQPTPPQEQGWLPIQRGEHTLILAPTGSGKTLAAFLWGIDQLFREPGRAAAQQAKRRKPADRSEGVRLVYISPLKALNNDIERNLRAPLEGIRAAAARANQTLPPLRVSVRTGDTPASVRMQMLKHPPDILITTPESLYLMLTSPRAREMFRPVRSVIVDEIHTLSGTKRGVHLALSLERLCHLAGRPVQRIGLSATIKPLDEVARFLGGQEMSLDGAVTPRPVTVVNAGFKKPLDLQVVTVVDDFRNMPGDSVWPTVIPHVLNDIRRHNTTLIFANNRRLAERTADRLNAQLAAEQSEEIEPGSIEALAPGGKMRDRGIFAIGAAGPIRAHHGSMSKEARRKMEEDLKAGRLPALVGTSSLELGIDIGAVDLVVQLQSPKSVAQGLQRVGRSGHIVGETSRGRIYPTFREDLAEAAAIARGMLEGDVEPTYTPQNPLDVLAQQIVAMAAMEEWSVPALYNLVRQAYPYHDLSPASFDSVLEMLAGKYYLDVPHLRPASSLRPKIAWDRVHNRLAALPGSRLLAISNVGTIPDTGAYGVYLGDGKTKVGELDEEFVFETRVGDVFLLGSNTWRVMDITDERIVVADAAGVTPRMPFWNGDLPYRPFELGSRIGKFRRELADRILAARERGDGGEPAGVYEWLEREYALDEKSARNLVDHVSRQLDAVGVMSSDQLIVVESFQNAVGDSLLVVQSPFGGRVNGAWAIALSSALRERTGVQPEMQANDDGIIFRFPQSNRPPPADMVAQLTPEQARERILRELPDSAAFGAQFRMNAARALLLPRARGGKRTPFWLQRLKAKDLLALVRRFEDFPILAETYRDCLRDVFDLPHLEEVLSRIQRGDIRVVPIETIIPSPVATGLLYNFVSVYMYEWDAPKAERQLEALSFKREALQDLLSGIQLSELLKPEAIAEVVQQARHTAPGYRARTIDELALVIRELGDLSAEEIVARSAGEGAAWLRDLAGQQRIVEVEIPTPRGIEPRWLAPELAEEYRAAFAESAPSAQLSEAALAVLRRFLRSAGPVTLEQVLDRYGFQKPQLEQALEGLTAGRELVRGQFTAPDRDEYCDSHLLERIHRRTLALLREEVKPVSLYAYSDFLLRWQHVAPGSRLRGAEGLRSVLEQLRGVGLPAVVWERDVLPARLEDYDPADLDALTRTGQVAWVGSGRDPRRGDLRFLLRGDGRLFLGEPEEEGLSLEAAAVYEYLNTEGASFAADIQAGLGLSAAAVRAALVELAMRGLATNDAMQTVRDIIAGPLPGQSEGAPERAPLSPLEAELAARMQRPRTLTQTRYREAKRRVAERLRTAVPAAVPSGRWALVRRAALLGPPLSDEERGERLARVLLARYGILTREAIEREAAGHESGSLYSTLQRLELRGQVRRGYFVSGLAGVQYALPEAVEQLRASSIDDEPVVVNAADPANLFGQELKDVALRFARVPSTHVVFSQGRPILVAEDNGERLTVPSGVERGLVLRALQAYLGRPNAGRRIVVSLWNGEPVLGGEGRSLLEPLGFSRTPTGMEWWTRR